MRQIYRIEVIVGIWVLVSPWILGYASLTPALWSNVLSGAVIGLLGLWQIFGDKAYKVNDQTQVYETR